MVVWIVLALAVFGLAYIRLAPSDPSRWHVPLDFNEEKTFRSGVQRVVDAGPDGLERLDSIIRATPRTTVLAGSVDNGHVTYVTRTKVLGFPDYTTVQQKGDTLRIYGRQRFGRSDFGVNRARVESWIDALKS